MILILILLFVCLYIFYHTKEPDEFIEVKKKYKILRNHIIKTNNQTFKILKTQIPLTGLKKMTNSVGSNTNKGAEIIICLDGDINDIFHVLLHELTHSTVNEYSHSPQFWKNLQELTDISVNLGIYEKIDQKKEFCGEHVQDK